MRITAKAREQSRRHILESAHQLFSIVGFEVATTRDIAKSAGLAAGTVFNYFPTKEALAEALVMRQSSRHQNPEYDFDSFEEALFAHAAKTMRTWKPCRTYVLPALEATMTSLGEIDQQGPSKTLRDWHLSGVVKLARTFLKNQTLSLLELHLYWTLFFGVVAFWVNDRSRKQEETLALLDQSVGMFASWIERMP